MSNDRALAKLLNRTALTKLLVQKLKHDEAVVAGIGNTNFDLFAAGHRAQNFYMLGSMGLACPIALGVALAQPERGVIALEGDGSILMGLGCLTTIATMKPRNLTVIIWDNGIYQITGSSRRRLAGRPTSSRSRAAPVSRRANGCATRRISKDCSTAGLRMTDRFYWRRRSTINRAKARPCAIPR